MNWKKWGPYLSERQWGTVREDYSEEGDAWGYFPFEASHARAYRWGEDGIGGISDENQILCFAFAFWNEKDPILKERFFGLSNAEGNHGEDVKEIYFYLDNVPDHSYMKMLYKYPQSAFPYDTLKHHNRSRSEPELELIDTGAFHEDRYFDLFIEYAKEDPENILIRCTPYNRGPDKNASLHILPTLWFRNTWVWKKEKPPGSIFAKEQHIQIEHPKLGVRYLYFDGSPELLFTDNETNAAALFQTNNHSPYTKDAFHEAVIHNKPQAINPKKTGTKAALRYKGAAPVRCRLSNRPLTRPFDDFDAIFVEKKAGADAFYKDKEPLQRQAWSSLLWSKQFYYYVVEEWLAGDDPNQAPSENRRHLRNARWRHFYSQTILLVPDKWEYPWFASWDTAFHSVCMAPIDVEFAKGQLATLFKDLFLHPSGQVPAYEWDFENINPPVLSWAALEVYNIEKKQTGKGDVQFLHQLFEKLLLTFTWWLNRKDPNDQGVFEGGFLGMDNISIFDRSTKFPEGVHLIQSDATTWMGMYCLHMSAIALELSEQDWAAKFFSIFLYIGEAMHQLWDEEEGFFYDHVHLPTGEDLPIRIHSYVGLIPLLAVAIFSKEKRASMQIYATHYQWMREHRPNLFEHIADLNAPGPHDERLFSFLKPEQLRRILGKMLDEEEFFSPYGIRSLSRYHRDHPYKVTHAQYHFEIQYEPSTSASPLFGGNSNWRGPIWMPINYLLIEALEIYHQYYGPSFTIECPAFSKQKLTLQEIANELRRRLLALFLPDANGRRPFYGDNEQVQKSPYFKDYTLFYEYFDGDNGRGLGASHQTGWTALIALIAARIKKREN